jgi:hypothetical protein
MEDQRFSLRSLEADAVKTVGGRLYPLSSDVKTEFFFL